MFEYYCSNQYVLLWDAWSECILHIFPKSCIWMPCGPGLVGANAGQSLTLVMYENTRKSQFSSGIPIRRQGLTTAGQFMVGTAVLHDCNLKSASSLITTGLWPDKWEIDDLDLCLHDTDVVFAAVTVPLKRIAIRVEITRIFQAWASNFLGLRSTVHIVSWEFRKLLQDNGASDTLDFMQQVGQPFTYYLLVLTSYAVLGWYQWQ